MGRLLIGFTFILQQDDHLNTQPARHYELQEKHGSDLPAEFLQKLCASVPRGARLDSDSTCPFTFHTINTFILKAFLHDNISSHLPETFCTVRYYTCLKQRLAWLFFRSDYHHTYPSSLTLQTLLLHANTEGGVWGRRTFCECPTQSN